MKQIPLTKGKFAIVDDEDYDFLMQWKWCYHIAGYAVRRGRLSEGEDNSKVILMHRVIINPSEGMSIDHINGNGLDNRKQNIREVTHGQNMLNKKIRKDSSSGIKGVQKHGKKWRALIGFGGNKIRIGAFNTPEEAALAYKMAVEKYHGQHGRVA